MAPKSASSSSVHEGGVAASEQPIRQGDARRPASSYNARMSASYPSVDESRDRLRRAGWSLGEARFGAAWQGDGSNGANRLLAVGTSQAEAWWRACFLARELGLPARAREGRRR
jgi:hypothetical protein